MERQDEDEQWGEAFKVDIPKKYFVSCPFPQSWSKFQTVIANFEAIVIPNSIIKLRQSQQVLCEVYRIAWRYHLPALQALFKIQGTSALILCRNSKDISFSQFYSQLQQLSRVQLLLQDPTRNWQELLRYIFSEGVKQHFESNKGVVQYDPQILNNLLAFIVRTDKTSPPLESLLAFLTELPQRAELDHFISHTRPFVTYVVFTINNRCRLIDGGFQALPYHQQATEIYSKNKTKKEFARNCISMSYFYLADEYSPPRLEKITNIQNAYLQRNWIITKGSNTEGQFQLIERSKEDFPFITDQQSNEQPLEVSPMKARNFAQNIKRQHKIFYNLFKNPHLHPKLELMLQTIEKRLQKEDLYLPFVQQGQTYNFQQFVCSIFICYNLILKKEGIQEIQNIFRLNFFRKTMTCQFKKYNPQTKSFSLITILLKMQEYFNIHVNPDLMSQTDMRILWNFVQKRMVVEAVKYILGGEMSGLDIRSIFSLFKGREYSSFMVRVKSIRNPDEKKAIIDSFLLTYHFEENPALFKLFSIHRNDHVGMFINTKQWQFPEEQRAYNIDCKTLPRDFDLIVHNIHQTSQSTLIYQYAENFRKQMKEKYPNMKISKIQFQKDSVYNIVLYIN